MAGRPRGVRNHPTGGFLHEEHPLTDAYETSYCARAIDCYDDVTLEALGWAEEADCLSFFDEAADDDDDDVACTFVADFATDCLDEVDAVSCDDFITGTWMDACLDTWDCEE